MTNWYLEKHDLSMTPSVLDGLDIIKESEYRKEGARFIMQLGTQLGLGYATVATGIVYFHKFYLFHSFKKISRYLAACCCLFLSGKAEETPKRAKDVIRTAKAMLKDLEIEELGENPVAEMMTLEKILLRAIQFDFQVDHPYRYLLKYAKCLKGKKEDLEQLVQIAWTFVNDSLCTTLCLQFQPNIIAIAFIYLASKILKFEVVDWENRRANQSYWWEVYNEGITIKFIEEICHELLDVYCSETSKKAERAKTNAVNKQGNKIFCSNESDNHKTGYLGTESLSFYEKVETVDSNFVIQPNKRKILYENDNVLDKSTTDILNEDVWNTLKKIQMSDITTYQKPANNAIPPIKFCKSNYNMPVSNFSGNCKRNGLSDGLVNIPHEKTNFSLSNNCSRSNNNLLCEPASILNKAISSSIHDFKRKRVCISQTPSEQPPNIFLNHSQNKNNFNDFNKIDPNNHMTVLQDNFHFELNNHKACASYPGYYNSGPNSLLQDSADSSQNVYAKTSFTSSSQHQFYLVQNPSESKDPYSSTKHLSNNYLI